MRSAHYLGSRTGAGSDNIIFESVAADYSDREDLLSVISTTVHKHFTVDTFSSYTVQ